MCFLIDVLNLRIFVNLILIIASSSLSVYGLECFHCSYSEDVDVYGSHLDFTKIQFAQQPPPDDYNCKNPFQYADANYFPPKVTCSSNASTCAKSLMRFTFTYYLYHAWNTQRIDVIIRNCTDKPLPQKGARCFPASEAADRIPTPNDPPDLNDTETFSGTMCLCGTEHCNGQPGFDQNDENFVTPTTSKSTSTTSTESHANVEPSAATDPWMIVGIVAGCVLLAAVVSLVACCLIPSCPLARRPKRQNGNAADVQADGQQGQGQYQGQYPQADGQGQGQYPQAYGQGQGQYQYQGQGQYPQVDGHGQGQYPGQQGPSQPGPVLRYEFGHARQAQYAPTPIFMPSNAGGRIGSGRGSGSDSASTASAESVEADVPNKLTKSHKTKAKTHRIKN